MSEEQQFCLRWNNFQANITSQFEALRDEEDFVDVTLACDGQRLKAHKVVLSACSPYFKELFKSNPCKHPILFLRDVAFHHLRALVEFMYAGEVNVAQAQLSAFLRTAESLQIRGLTEAPQRHKQPHNKQQQPQQQQQRQQQQQSSAPSEVSATAGVDSSSAADEVASSPECVGIDDDDDDALSMSPSAGGGGSSPTSAKRQCLQQDGSETPHNRTQTSTSSSDLRHEMETGSKDSPVEMVEPKLELPDYSSDGESKTGTSAFLGLDSNSVDVNASFAAALHSGGMDILPGPSGQGFLGEPSGSLDSGQVDHRKLHSLDPRPCPICNRMYSNLSNLRQHVRLIHNPQTVACPLCSKPFKTKLYLKRHLMSFHELVCTSNNPAGGQMIPKPGAPADFYPPPPQVFLGSHSGGDEEDGKNVSEGLSKGKDPNFLEILNVSRGNLSHNSSSQSGHEDKTTTPKNKEIQEAFYQRGFAGMYQPTGHEDKPNFFKNMDLYQIQRKFQNVISPLPGNDNKNNYIGSNTAAQHSKGKDGQIFHSNEDKGGIYIKNKELLQGQNSEYFQSPRSFPSATQLSQGGSGEKDNFGSNQNFSSGEDRSVYGGRAGENEVPSYATDNHKENNYVSYQNRNQENSIPSSDYQPPKQENPSSCSNYNMSLTNSENARLQLLSPPGGESMTAYSNQENTS